MEEATDMSLKGIGVAEKIYLATFYGLIALVFGIAVYFVIRKIAELNIRRGIIKREELDIKYNKSDERVFNIPFIVIIVVYLLYMMMGVIIKYLSGI